MPKQPEKDPYKKLPARVRVIVDRCRDGEKLCLNLRPRRFDGDADDWFYEPSGKRATPISALQATQTPFLRAAGDGLFPDSSQTWTAA